jgi:hypothetical protein
MQSSANEYWLYACPLGVEKNYLPKHQIIFYQKQKLSINIWQLFTNANNQE